MYITVYITQQALSVFKLAIKWFIRLSNETTNSSCLHQKLTIYFYKLNVLMKSKFKTFNFHFIKEQKLRKDILLLCNVRKCIKR